MPGFASQVCALHTQRKKRDQGLWWMEHGAQLQHAPAGVKQAEEEPSDYRLEGDSSPRDLSSVGGSDLHHK